MDKIIVNQAEVFIKDIDKISFSIRDYKGMKTSLKGELDGCKSNGVGNSVILYDKTGNRQIYFQLLSEYALRDIKEQLIHYHVKGKLHFLQLIDILGISRYEDIQEFKKEIYDETAIG